MSAIPAFWVMFHVMRRGKGRYVGLTEPPTEEEFKKILKKVKLDMDKDTVARKLEQVK